MYIPMSVSQAIRATTRRVVCEPMATRPIMNTSHRYDFTLSVFSVALC